MIEFTQLDKLIDKLEDNVQMAARPVIGDTSKEQWNDIFELMPIIQEHFKAVRYPQKFDREQAWQKFNSLRNQAFEAKNEQFLEKSKFHYKDLWRQLENADYNWGADIIAQEVLWGTFKVSIETMKDRGAMLKEAGNYFKENKSEMTKDHKAEIHEKFIDVRESHDVFWNRVREYREEQNKVYEKKREAWEEKQEKSKAIKERIENNLQKNKEKLEKAEEFLERMEGQKRDLEDKISSAYSDSFRERHEEWLSEKEDKIRDVEKQIERYNDWIREDEEKLNNWN